jgi:dihydrofolate synthase / folylpolyglutamate synthase
VTLPYAELLQKLYTLVPRGALLGLDRVREAAHRLQDVHQLGTYVHIAGTNGKGSTAAFVAQMGKKAGTKVGLYTSPHLCRFAERIRVDGEPVAEEVLAPALEKALSVAEDLTFFEVATLAALLVFREANVELSVVEVGLGGRLDATNIVEGTPITAITRIAFDHMNRLGTTLREIAREKAGILRPGAPCIVGRLHPDAKAVIYEQAERIGAFVHEATTEEELQLVNNYPPSLAGVFQHTNSMVAVAIGRALGFSTQAIAEGLSSTEWPGRFEIIETDEGYVVVDSAHNPDGALALKNSLLGVGAAMSRRQIALVFGCMADKNWRAMLDRLSAVTGPRVYLQPQGRTPVPCEELQAYMEGTAATTVEEALRIARKQVGKHGLVVVAGSIFLAGQMRAHLLHLPMDPPVAL